MWDNWARQKNPFLVELFLQYKLTKTWTIMITRSIFTAIHSTHKIDNDLCV